MKIDSYTLLVPLCGNNGLIGERAQVAGSKKLFQPRVAIAALFAGTLRRRLRLFSFAEYLAACCKDEGEENPP